MSIVKKIVIVFIVFSLAAIFSGSDIKYLEKDSQDIADLKEESLCIISTDIINICIKQKKSLPKETFL